MLTALDMASGGVPSGGRVPGGRTTPSTVIHSVTTGRLALAVTPGNFWLPMMRFSQAV